MAKKSPKQPWPSAPKPKAPPPNVQKQSLPPAAVKKMIDFYRDNREIERNIWRSIYG